MEQTLKRVLDPCSGSLLKCSLSESEHYMPQLSAPWNDWEKPSLSAALKLANQAASAFGAGQDVDGRIRLTGPLPPDYKRQIMSGSTAFSIIANEHGSIFSVSEAQGDSSGGWIGSCIPNSTLSSLLVLWSKQQATPIQQSLF